MTSTGSFITHPYDSVGRRANARRRAGGHGAYAKGILPITPDFRLYGLAGFTEVDFDVDDETGFSWGGGAEFDVAPNLALGADYIRYLDESNYTFDAASVGMTFRF